MIRLRCVVACPGTEVAGGTGCPPRLCQEGKRKLTESAKEFPKASAWQSPKGPFREALERKGMPPRFFIWSTLSRHRSSSPFISRCPFTCAHSAARRAPGRSLLIFVVSLFPRRWNPVAFALFPEGFARETKYLRAGCAAAVYPLQH